jgi:hypothetical protein
MVKFVVVSFGLLLALGTILGSQIMCSSEPSRARLTEAQMRSLASEIVAHREKHGFLPYSLEHLVSIGALRRVHTVDAWGKPLAYLVESSGTSFVLSSSAPRHSHPFWHKGHTSISLEFSGHGS